MSAVAGAIGSSSSPIRTQTTRIDATAQNGIWISETGDLETGAIASTGNSVNLTATGSILDADPGVVINVRGPALNLSAGTGSIGLSGHALRIDASVAAGALNASALTESMPSTSAGLGIGTVTSATELLRWQPMTPAPRGETSCSARHRCWSRRSGT
jgi:hypothetical protein